MQREKIVLLVQVARYFNRQAVRSKLWGEAGAFIGGRHKTERDTRMAYARKLARLVKPTVWDVERFGVDGPIAKVVASTESAAYAMFVCQCQDDEATVFGNEYVRDTGAAVRGPGRFLEWCV